jgi:hypothetical protein
MHRSKPAPLLDHLVGARSVSRFTNQGFGRFRDARRILLMSPWWTIGLATATGLAC